MRPRCIGAVAALVVTASATHAQPSARAASAEPPRLVVLITVDQLRADYADRFQRQLTGGLGRLYREGAAFTGAQDHANTETAPGHASTLSGRFPSHTGIARNSAGVADPQAPLLGGGGTGASPFRFRGSTLIDWMRTADPRARALSVSRKDRGAILPLGRAHQQAYWYAGDGRFTTSTYYADTLPTWVTAFNARRIPQSRAGQAWTLLLPEREYPEPDSVPAESGGRGYLFPHVLPSDPDSAARQFPEFPWMDDLTMELALTGMRELRLGEGPQTDLLAISLSTTDAVGHRYGPDSRELHDQVLRLDRLLGRLLDTLGAGRDSGRVIVALTADHGVAPYPGVRSSDPNAGARRVNLTPQYEAARDALARRGVPEAAFAFVDGMIGVDRAAFARAGVRVDSVLGAFATTVARVPGVQRVDLWGDLAKADTTRDAVARRWLHMFTPDFAPALVVTLEPYSVWGPATYAQHGSPHDYDTNVPVVFYGAPFRPGRYDRIVRVVDIAPTLAAVLGVPPTEPLDGRVLHEALRQPASAEQP